MLSVLGARRTGFNANLSAAKRLSSRPDGGFIGMLGELGILTHGIWQDGKPGASIFSVGRASFLRHKDSSPLSW
jgi:hypothetical protein